MADGQRTIKIRFDGSARGLSAAAKEARAQLRAVRQATEDDARRVAAMGDRLGTVTRAVVRNFAKVAVAGAAIHGTITVVAALTAALSNMLGVAGLLPGVFAAWAAAMVVVKLGGDGIKRAFQRLTPILEELSSAVSATFEKGLRPAVDDLNDTLPRLRGNLTRVAESLSRVATRFTGMLRRGRNVRTLNTILAASARTIDNVGAALAPLGQALLDVAAVGGEVFADLTDGAGDAAEKFAAWVRAARDSGRLRDWIQGGIDAVAEFARIMRDLGDIVSGVFTAIREGAGGVGGALGPAITTVKNFVNSARGQETFRTLGRVLSDLGRIVSAVLGPALQAVSAVLQPFAPVVGTIADAAEQHLKPALEKLVPALAELAEKLAPVIAGLVEDLAPHLPVIAGAIAALAGPIGNAAAAFDGLALKVGLAALAFFKLRGMVTTALTGFGALVGGQLGKAGTEADKSGRGTGNKFTRGLKTTLRAGMRGVGALLIADIITTFVPIKDVVTGESMTASQAIITSFERAVEWWNTGKLPKAVIGGTALAEGEYKGFWDRVLNKTDISAATGVNIIGRKSSQWRSLFTDSQSRMNANNNTFWGNVLGRTRGATNTIAGEIGNKSGRMRSFWSGGLNGADADTRKAWARMVVTTRAKSLQAAAEARSGGRQIRGAFNFSLWSQGSAILSSLRAGMATALPGVLGFAAGIAARIAAVKGPLRKDRRLLVPQGRAIMDGLATGMAAGLPSVLRLASQVAPGVAAAVAGRSYLSRPLRTVAPAAANNLTVQAVPEVRVYIGDRELTDIVDVRINESNRGLTRRVLAGTGGAG